MTNILVVAGEYPPIKTIGRIRTAKAVQHWTEAGHKPVVLTVSYDESNPNFEQELQLEIPENTPIYRVDNPKREDVLINLVKSLSGRKPKDSVAQPVAASGTENTSSTQPSSAPQSASFSDKIMALYKSVVRNWIDLPDDYVGWSSLSYPVALDIIKKHNIDVIYASLPPFSSFKLARKLKQETGLPLVVDYRDLWSGDVLREWVPTLRAKIEFWLEKKYLRDVDAVITVSGQKTEYVQGIVPYSKAKFVTITNGFDLDSFDSLLEEHQEKVKGQEAKTSIDMVYCGRLFKNRKGYNFLTALGKIKQASPELVEQMRVHYYGGIEDRIFKRYQEIIDEYSLQDNFVFHGDVPFTDAKRAMVSADILLLIVDSGATTDGVIPGKLFEYIAVKRPIFGLSDSAATNDIIRKSNVGKIVPTEDLDACIAGLREILERYPDIPERDENYIAQFDRRLLSNKFLDTFSDILTDAKRT